MDKAAVVRIGNGLNTQNDMSNGILLLGVKVGNQKLVKKLVKCENWIRDDTIDQRNQKRNGVDWAYPFEEKKLFVLTLSVGLEGYHVHSDGRHVTSFPYHTRHLEMSSAWQALPLSDGPVELFIGILSAGNHFTERMVVRKSWMQSKLIKLANVVA
ncbi:hypothetical protein C5167_045505 [Papaver somniferum]|uniref:Galectin domain-containing protein n=1 Tax=Papaver somniferum TaxID=3469 RepID=A0A4Y7LER8_PAPSO|nr:hypothetical protein C5167_045505 [Papaver somniferum]